MCPSPRFSITHSVCVLTLSVHLFPFNPCSPPNLNHLCCPHFFISPQFPRTGCAAFFSLSLALSIIPASFSPSFFYSLTHRAVFRGKSNPLSFLNPLFHFTPILSHCSAHTIPAPPAFQTLFLCFHKHTLVFLLLSGHSLR